MPESAVFLERTTFWPGTSAVHWLSPPPGARVKPYDINEPGDQHFAGGIPLSLPVERFIFDQFIDPA